MGRKSRWSALAPAAAASLLGAAGGCATLVQGSQQYLTVNSRPSATARAGDRSCRTPCSLLVPRSRDATVVVEEPGHVTSRVPVAREIDPLVLGNLVLPPFSILWGMVDLATGAGFRLRPSYLDVSLEPSPVVARAQPSASRDSAAE